MCTDNPERFTELETHQINPRRVDIKTTQVVVEFTRLSGDNGEKIKSEVNTELFCKIGAIFRWCKNQCNVKNQEGFDNLSFASDDVDLEASRRYIIKLPLYDSKVIANIILTYGVVTKLDINVNDFSMQLEDEEVDEENCIQFTKIKDKKNIGIAFNSEYLGFELPQQTISTVMHDDGMYHNMQEVVDAHPDKEFSWLLGMNYHIVHEDELDKIIDYIYNFDGLVYYDTETSGLNINFLSRIGQADQCVGIILSVVYGESFFFPMQMKKIKNLCNGDHNYFMEHYVRKILEGYYCS